MPAVPVADHGACYPCAWGHVPRARPYQSASYPWSFYPPYFRGFRWFKASPPPCFRFLSRLKVLSVQWNHWRAKGLSPQLCVQESQPEQSRPPRVQSISSLQSHKEYSFIRYSLDRETYSLSRDIALSHTKEKYSSVFMDLLCQPQSDKI